MPGLRGWFFVRGFVRALKRQTPLAPDRAALQRRIAAMPHVHVMPGDDRQAAFNLLLARSLSAAVSHLEDEGQPRPVAVSIARAAFLENGSGFVRVVFGTWLAATRDPVRAMQRRRDLSRKAHAMWGNGMQTQMVATENSVALQVMRCPFADYFWNMAEPDLTPILCAYDAQWMAQVNRSSRPVTASRAGTIAAGSDCCDFTFSRQVPDRIRLRPDDQPSGVNR